MDTFNFTYPYWSFNGQLFPSLQWISHSNQTLSKANSDRTWILSPPSCHLGTSTKAPSTTRSRGPCHYFTTTIQIRWKQCVLEPNSNQVITTKFYTCHNSTAVLACVKIGCNLMTGKEFSMKFALWEKIVSKTDITSQIKAETNMKSTLHPNAQITLIFNCFGMQSRTSSTVSMM